MKRYRALFIATAVFICLYYPHLAAAIAIGQTDTFEDGTTQNWVVGLLGATHPAPPANIADGGPLGAEDNYLQLTSVGGSGAGNRMAVINLAQWAGNYSAAGVTDITMNLINLGATDLFIRLYLENPEGGPPNDQAITESFFLPAGDGWTDARFSIHPSALIALLGEVDTLLSNVTALRIIHSPDEDFRGPPIVAMLGVDNITATIGSIPEPSVLALLAVGLFGLGLRKQK